jgi:KDO2-lipid IV(A) lauroyltransferase
MNFEAYGISILETAIAWWAPDHRLKSLFKIHGIEYLRKGSREGRGVILCSAHFLSMELAGRFLLLELPFAVVYRSQKNGVLDYVSRRCRTRLYEKLIAHDDIRGIVNALGENRVVWYTPDVDPGRRRKGVFAPFFGVPAYTPTALARIARLSGAKVVPAFPYRRGDGTGYDVVLGPPLDGFPSNDMVYDATRINEIIERAIRSAPDQYLWQYKRFKTRPPGEQTVYERHF